MQVAGTFARGSLRCKRRGSRGVQGTRGHTRVHPCTPSPVCSAHALAHTSPPGSLCSPACRLCTHPLPAEPVPISQYPLEHPQLQCPECLQRGEYAGTQVSKRPSTVPPSCGFRVYVVGDETILGSVPGPRRAQGAGTGWRRKRPGKGAGEGGGGWVGLQVYLSKQEPDAGTDVLVWPGWGWGDLHPKVAGSSELRSLPGLGHAPEDPLPLHGPSINRCPQPCGNCGHPIRGSVLSPRVIPKLHPGLEACRDILFAPS